MLSTYKPDTSNAVHYVFYERGSNLQEDQSAMRGDLINPLSSSELYPWIDECLPLAPARQTLPHEI